MRGQAEKVLGLLDLFRGFLWRRQMGKIEYEAFRAVF